MRYATTILIALALLGCNQKTETQTVNTPTGTVQQKTTTVTVNPQVDTTMTAEAKQDAKQAVRDAQTATREVVHDTKPAKKKH
ncbi:MAG TPA: hypothetical protein VJ853_08010 [Thermoanaerobaculia bacterium]|nr:hypothetical protein [Thermoanaerobaculia bacterium]